VKKLLVIMALLELFLALLVISPIFVDRRDLARAVYNYSQEPTEENRKRLEAEQEITARIRLHGRLVIVGLFAANTCGLVAVCHRLNRQPKAT